MLPVGLNMGNYKLYHVENGVTNEMTLLNGEPVHNSFIYDPVTGDVNLYLASFSEVAVVADTTKAWAGGVEEFADGSGTKDDPYIIANADQLAYFGKVVGGMDGYTQKTFDGEYVKLVADINLGYGVENHTYRMFHPIGYYFNENYDLGNGKIGVYSAVYSFEGTFNGNGHTIANFYHNTWEIKGDYNEGYPANSNYYKDAMGLFGYVVNGKIENLTVDNFSSDGEFTPTGVIAAYAVNSAFENIAITNCNPRVYNTGNGGIVGIGGNSTDTNTSKLTFTNITVDNSNKISALWGSWDVACGGLMGMFRGNGLVEFTNCHMAAQIDVFNDVCGNYQYYWYRYAGMMIGSIRGKNTTDGSYTVPDISGITATNCTVDFGDWNGYYYCELVANSLASYTHDHQFSRLEQIASLNDIKNGDTWTRTGNFLLINGDTKTCYHIVSENGVLTEHKHADAGTEVINGETVLKENNQIIFLPFNQLIQGDGWGVKHVAVNDFDGITILYGENSVEKFEGIANSTLESNKTYTLSELFQALEGKEIYSSGVWVTITKLDENDTVAGEFSKNIDNWENGTVSFTGTGSVEIKIQDYNYCKPTTITVTLKDKEPEVKFENKFTGNFLYRVGNGNAVTLDSLFSAKDRVSIGTVDVQFETISGTASGVYTSNATWTNGSIKFSGTGVVKVTITDNDNYCIPTVLYLEVVDAVNATTATNATENNVVLLNDIGSGFTVSGNYTVFGNGFTLNYTGDGRYLNNGLKQGIVTVSENGTLDNLKIKASIYPTAFMYYGTTALGDYVQQSSNPREVDGEKTRYYYQLSGVVAKGNATVSNCYIYGARTNIFVDTGDVTIKDTILECGTVANVQIQSTNEYTVTFENVTTIQYQVNATIGDTSKVMLGAGVLVGPDTDTNPTIVLKEEFKQYNWVNKDDQNAVSGTMAQMIIEGALNATAYNHTINEKPSSNLGIIYMNNENFVVDNQTNLPYESGTVTMKVDNKSIDGQVYSLQGANADEIYSDYENADRSTVNGNYIPRFDFNLGDQEISYDGSEDTRYLYGDKNGVTALYQDGADALTLDLTKLATIYKYDGINYVVTAVCKNSNGNTLIATNGVVTLSAQGSYSLEFTVTDNIFYNNKGEAITNSVLRTYTVPLTLTVKAADVKNAEVSITKTALDGVYTTVNLTDYKLRINFLDVISVTDYDNTGSGTTVSLSSNIASATLTPEGVNVFTTASTITITYTDGRVLTVNLSKISGSSPGTKTAIVNTSGGLYFITDGALDNKPTESSSQNICTITSVSFKGNSGSTITKDTGVTVTWELGSSGPCVTPDTLVTMADGTQVRVDSLTGNENLLVWNHETGKFDIAPIAYIVDHDKVVQNREIIHLYFSNGSEVKIIGEHVFYDATLNKYIAIDSNNAEEFIGHKFLGLGDSSLSEVELVAVDRTVEETEVYEVVSYKHLTCFTNGILSTSAYLDKLLNVFDINTETYAYDAEAVQKDIEAYGLYTYADFEGLISEEAFELYNAKYLKIAVEKGYITWDDILDLIDIYFNVDVQPIQ